MGLCSRYLQLHDTYQLSLRHTSELECAGKRCACGNDTCVEYFYVPANKTYMPDSKQGKLTHQTCNYCMAPRVANHKHGMVFLVAPEDVELEDLDDPPPSGHEFIMTNSTPKSHDIRDKACEKCYNTIGHQLFRVLSYWIRLHPKGERCEHSTEVWMKTFGDMTNRVRTEGGKFEIVKEWIEDVPSVWEPVENICETMLSFCRQREIALMEKLKMALAAPIDEEDQAQSDADLEGELEAEEDNGVDMEDSVPKTRQDGEPDDEAMPNATPSTSPSPQKKDKKAKAKKKKKSKGEESPIAGWVPVDEQHLDDLHADAVSANEDAETAAVDAAAAEAAADKNERDQHRLEGGHSIMGTRPTQ